MIIKKLLMDSIMNIKNIYSDLDIRPNDINNLMHNALTNFEPKYTHLRTCKFSSHSNLKEKYTPLSNHMYLF